MGLKGVMINQIVIKSDGDVFHEIFRHRPHNISTMAAGKIEKCELHEGQWGNVGSVISWNYVLDGKKSIAKERITAIDEDKKLVTFKVIDGDLMEFYKSFIITVHVETHGENNLVTWTFDYEKLNDTVPYPSALMNFCLHITKDIESHHL